MALDHGAEARGRAEAGEDVMEHGTYSRYVAGRCRCDECRRAAREHARDMNRRKAYGRELFVDAELARQRLAELLAMGYSRKEICRLSGVGHSWMHSLEHFHPRTGEPVTRCKRSNYDALLAIGGRRLASGQKVPAEPAMAIVRRLKAAGMPVAEMARVTGVNRQTLDALLHGRRTFTSARTLDAIVRNLDELWARAPKTIRKWVPKSGVRRVA